jgi:4-amino-4-deoxy-L-arabinose transferase-like glycosyltransferase
MKKWVPVIILLTLFATSAVSSSIRKSAVWDETHYLGIGSYLFENLTWDIPSVSLHPPLPYYLSSFPLIFCDLEPSCFKRGSEADVIAGVRRGQCLLRNSDPYGDRLLFLARLPSICLGVALGVVLYLWASQIYGTAGGLFSLALYCLSPNILAHSRFATPDLPLTFFGFAAAYFFWRSARSASVSAPVFCGIFLGLALLCKYSALIWIPILAAMASLAAIPRVSDPGGDEKSMRGLGLLGRCAAILAVALLVVCLGYGFNVSAYFSGIQTQQEIAGEGFPGFLNGDVSSEGWWYYHLFALLIKTPLPLLICVLASAILCRTIWRSRWFEGACMLIPAIGFLGAFSIFHKVNLGVRYILPALPFLIVFAGGVTLLRPKWKNSWTMALAGLLLWQAFESVSIYPDYLAYFNQLAGGPQNGYLHLVDSNLDWGQDLKGLKKYMEEGDIEKVKLSYFGTAMPEQYGIAYEALPSFVLLNPPRLRTPLKSGDILAVSATNMYPLFIDLGRHASATPSSSMRSASLRRGLVLNYKVLRCFSMILLMLV